MAFCKGCGQAIDWYKTAAGKNMPIDPDPHPDGNVYIDVVRNVAVVAAVGAKPKMYRPHWATCVKAGQFRATPRPACDHEGCERTDRHTHCRRCGTTDHWVAECPEEP